MPVHLRVELEWNKGDDTARVACEGAVVGVKYVILLSHCLIALSLQNCRQAGNPGSGTVSSESFEKTILSKVFSYGAGGWAMNLEFKPDQSYEFA